jgi:hypothetical protein
MQSKPFRWSQLMSAKDYRVYVANLRAIGCPEPTIEDIVRGDVDRTFSWERSQLGLDGSGSGPWSRSREMKLIGSLLGEQRPAGETAAVAQNTENTMPGNNGGGELSPIANPAQRTGGDEIGQISVLARNTEAATPAYPLFLQNVNWSALGFSADQQAAIAQVRLQFQNEIDSLNQNSSGPANQNPDDSKALAQWQTALQTANNQLRDSLGAQAYMAYEQQQYDIYYRTHGTSLKGWEMWEAGNFNPDASSVSQ